MICVEGQTEPKSQDLSLNISSKSMALQWLAVRWRCDGGGLEGRAVRAGGAGQHHRPRKGEAHCALAS